MIRKSIAGLTAAAAIAAPLALGVPAQATGPSSKPTIAEVLLSDDKATGQPNVFDTDWYDFDVVTQAVLAFGDLTDAARNPDAELTVFAPNDRAFQVLVRDLTGKWEPSEKATFDALVKWAVGIAGTADGGLELIKTVLKYHIVAGAISAETALRADKETPPTLLGSGPEQTFEVDVVSKAFKFIVLKDEDKTDLNPWIVRSKFNVGGELSNGYIHGIGLVLRPVDLP